MAWFNFKDSDSDHLSQLLLGHPPQPGFGRAPLPGFGPPLQPGFCHPLQPGFGLSSQDKLKISSQSELIQLFIHSAGKKEPDEILHWLWNNYSLDSRDFITSGKDEKKAEHFRMMGNQFYQGKNYVKALSFYNLSIKYAPHPVLDNVKIEEPEDDMDEFAFPRIDPARYGGVELEKCSTLGIGFANRSAVMLAIGKYDQCIKDIDLALEYGYPNNMRHKLEERRLKCRKEQRKVELSDLGQKTTGVKDPLSAVEMGFEELSSPEIPKPPKILNPHPCVPALSSAVKVSHLHDKGRGLIATRDIKPGEVIGVERAFAVSLQEKQYQIHCSTCTIPCLNGLPCPGCNQVIFCSKSCRAKGLAEDHWLECKILASVNSWGLNDVALCYKMLKTFNFHQIQSMCAKLKKNKPVRPEDLGFNDQGKYSSSSFLPLYHLHQEEGTFSEQAMALICLKAFHFTKLLDWSKRYFVDDFGKPVPVTKDSFMKTCKLMMNHIEKRIRNAFGDGNESLNQEVIPLNAGEQIFTVKSLINHSCSPVLDHSTLGRVSFWYAVKPIAAGEELTIVYNSKFDDRKKSSRKEDLKYIGFDCKCQACQGNWLTSPYLPEIRLLCPNCNSGHTNVNMHCYESRKLDSAIEVLNQVLEKGSVGEPVTKQDFVRLCKAAEVAFKYTTMPCKLLLKFMKVIKHCGDIGLM